MRETMTLTKLLEFGRSLETSEQHAKTVETSKQSANAVSSKGRRPPQQQRHGYGKQGHKSKQTYHSKKQGQATCSHANKSHSKPNNSQSSTDTNMCTRCGHTLPHKNGSCPAMGSECHKCHGKNHWGRMCHTRKSAVNATCTAVEDNESQSDSEPDYVYMVTDDEATSSVHKQKLPMSHVVLMDKVNALILVDTGSTVNILDSNTFQKLDPQPKLRRPDQEVFLYGDRPALPVLGIAAIRVHAPATNRTDVDFHIVHGNTGNLLSCHTSQELQFVQLTYHIQSYNDVYTEYDSLFTGVGKIKDVEIKLHIDESVPPKSQRHRRTPFHTRKDVEAELERLKAHDLIETVNGPTPWVSPIVTVPKKNGVRLCVDMREANKAIKRTRHPLPTLDDVIADLNGASWFSTLDMNSGFHQFRLHPDSRDITTFSCHAGLFRFKSLMFNVNSAPEVFQSAVEQLLSGIPGCKNMADDILVYGCTKDEHDRNLRLVLNRLKEHGATLNKDKCTFGQQSVKFYGHIFSAAGVKADPKKIQDVCTAPAPTNSSEMSSFLGMAQYLAKYIPNYSTLTAPLRELTHQNVPWVWGDVESEAYQKLKDELTSSRVMTYFDPTMSIDIYVDASPVGLCAILTQNDKVLAYGSRALKDVETRYSQTEREMLAVVWAAEHYHLYVFGTHFRIFTDHKPLLRIFEKQNPLSARMDHWRLRLMPYDYTLVYRPGADNPADFLSRHPGGRAPHNPQAEAYVNYICSNAIPKAMTLQQVQSASKTDLTMHALKEAITSDNWQNPLVKDYLCVKDELSVVGDLILRDQRLIIPQELQQKAVELAHIGHQGIVKTKQLLREKVWFPGIDRRAEELIKSCNPCQAATRAGAERIEPLNMTDLPDGPWKQVSIDFKGPFPTGELVMVIIDDYSRFPEVEIVRSTSARSVIPKIDAVFARQGIPEIVKTDNGPPFNSKEFKDFASYLGFDHQTSTPLWPRGNAEVERFNGTLVKAVQTATVAGLNWKQELYTFLRQYRATPHATTNMSPSEALNNRKLRTVLPEVPSTQPSEIKNTDRARKAKIKAHGDKHLKTKRSKLKVGDKVLVRQNKQNALSTPFDPSPYTVTWRKGNSVVAKRGNQTIRRNISFFKIVNETPQLPSQHNSATQDDHVDCNPDPPNPDPDGPAVNLPQDQQRNDRPQRHREIPARLKDYVLT